MSSNSERPRAFESDPIEWALSLDPSERLGSKHHTVPIVYLRHFAQDGRVRIRRREGGVARTTNIRDFAIRDFYSMVRDDGTPDAGIEQILGVVEGAVAPVLDRLMNPLLARRPLEPAEFFPLVQFVGFQLVRGAGHRREQELMADYLAKSSISTKTPGPRTRSKAKRPTHRYSEEDLAQVRVVGHQNEYLRHFGELAEKVTEQLFDRPATVIEVADPLFITCDEPVLVNTDGDHVEHRPECFETPRERRIRVKRELRRTGSYSQVVHVYPTRRSGISDAKEVGLTISPRHFLVFGEKGTHAPPHKLLDTTQSAEPVSEVNSLITTQAFDWIVARPDNSAFDELIVPPVGPLVRVCDGNSALSRALDAPPEPRRPGRFRKDW